MDLNGWLLFAISNVCHNEISYSIIKSHLFSVALTVSFYLSRLQSLATVSIDSIRV